jgi:hypothetical protein
MTLVIAFLLSLTVSTSAQDVPPWRQVGYYDHLPIRESSGLAASRQHEGVYWTLNDSGNPDSIYATGLDGKLIREFTVNGARNRDWEAIAIDSAGQLWIGGIGNNSRQRDDLKVYVLSEPDPLDPTATAEVTAAYPYRFPAENVDAEGMFIHDGLPHIISKEARRAVLYRFRELVPDQPHTLERVGELASDAYRITGASLSEDGTMLAAVTYGRLWVYHSVKPINLVNLIRTKPWTMPHDFGVEACTFDGDNLVLSNEARSLYLLPRYWYERGDAMPPQGALSAVSLYPDQTSAQSGRVELQTYQAAGIPIAGNHLTLTPDGPDAAVTQTVNIERDDLWEISTIMTRGPRYGRFELLVDGVVVGRPYDCGASEVTAGTVATFGSVHLEAGTRTLTLRMAGEIAESSLGLDGYLIQAASAFAERYMVAGPFDRKSEMNIDEALQPEIELDLKDAYTGLDDREVIWRTADANASGRLDLVQTFKEAPAIAQAYAMTSVYTETARDAVLLVGADDQVAVWVNGQEIHRNNRRGGAFPDEDKVPCHLDAGWNQVLCKVGQNGGNWALYLRFNDSDGSLKYAVGR